MLMVGRGVEQAQPPIDRDEFNETAPGKVVPTTTEKGTYSGFRTGIGRDIEASDLSLVSVWSQQDASAIPSMKDCIYPTQKRRSLDGAY